MLIYCARKVLLTDDRALTLKASIFMVWANSTRKCFWSLTLSMHIALCPSLAAGEGHRTGISEVLAKGGVCSKR
jgi:hypothetical protein